MQSALARAGGAASTSLRCACPAASTSWLGAATCARRAAVVGRRPLRVAAVAMPSTTTATAAALTSTSSSATAPHSTPRRPPPRPPTPTPRGGTPPGGWTAVGTSPTGAAFVVDKPPGWTSFDVCGALRAALGVRRVGHAGTLDPLATGVLVVCAGRATKAVPAFTDADKEYTGVLRLGEATETLDAGSPVSETAAWHHVSDADLAAAASALTGPAVVQRVPMYSAIKVGGARLSASARAGVDVADRPERAVRVDAFELMRLECGYSPPPGEAAAAAREVARVQARARRAAAEAAVVAAGVTLPDKKAAARTRRRRRRSADGAPDPVEAAIASALASLPPPPPPPAPVDPPSPGPHGCRDVAFRVVCAKGTYVRTLAADLGRAVGSIAHVVALRRTRVGECLVGSGDAWGVEELVAAARAGRAAEAP
jgi:tRNA pseudouridine(55) synthase